MHYMETSTKTGNGLEDSSEWMKITKKGLAVKFMGVELPSDIELLI